jgi:alcohol dehydrogenase class IV
MGERVEDLTPVEGARIALDAVAELSADLNVPNLAEAGVDLAKFREMAPKMAEDALASGSPTNNPRTPTKQEVVDLYHRVADSCR